MSVNFYKPSFDWQQFVGKPFYKNYPERKNMAYNKFTTLQEALDRLNLQIIYVKTIVEGYTLQPPSKLLQANLQNGAALATKISTEKARSELIVSPILMEIVTLRKNTINYFSGINFRVDPKRGLTGRCDFMIGQGQQTDDISAPILTIVEAKNDNTKNGLGQCVAEMYAAQLFNERKQKPIPAIYGTITNGINWRFMKLEKEVVYLEELDKVYDFERNLDELLGLLLRITETQL